MKKIMIVYSSMTGNTEMMAESIADGIRSINHHVILKDVLLTDFTDLLNYDAILLGAYTWIDGSLPDEFQDFFEDMEELDLSGKKAAAFGSGDSGYEIFCAAVDILEDRLIYCGAELVQPGLKIEQTPSETELEQCKQFGIGIAMQL